MNEITKELLHQKYIVEGKSGLQVSKELDIPRTSLTRLLDKFGIPRKSISLVMTGKKLSPEHRIKVIKTLKYGKGDKSASWNGGRFIDSNGYYRVWVDGVYVKEHRLVMEKHLGRRLLKSEHIHHIDGNTLNNNVDNLLIMDRAEHVKMHMSDQKKRRLLSEKIKAIRKEKFWSTRKKII